MSVFLLDTDTLTLVQHRHAAVMQRAASYPDTTIFISAVSLQEQMKGWLGRLVRLNKPDQVSDWYDRLVLRLFPVWKKYPLLSFSEPAIARFENLRSMKLQVASMDLRIAAVALENTLTVVTRNLRDFGRVPGLPIVDWST